MNVNKMYKNGEEVSLSLRETKPLLIKPTKRLRNKVNKFLREFLDSDSEYGEIQFEGEIIPRNVFKAYYNIKTCANCWDQHVIAHVTGWPDVIGKVVKSFDSNEAASSEEGSVVMLNEVLSENYSSKTDYIPKGYEIKNHEQSL